MSFCNLRDTVLTCFFSIFLFCSQVFIYIAIFYLTRGNCATFYSLCLILIYQEPKLEEQIQKVVSMASLTVVCEIIDQKPELQLESLQPVETLKRFISSAQLNQVLKKPSSIEEKSRYVCAMNHV